MGAKVTKYAKVLNLGPSMPVSSDDCKLEALLIILGLFPDCDALADAASDVGLELPVTGELTLGHAWRFLEVYRAREGFTRAEAADIRETFQTYAKHIDGQVSEIDTVDVRR